MSTCAVFEDEHEFNESIAFVRADTSDDVFVIVGHVDNDPLRVHVVYVGRNVDEIVDHLDDSQVMYILARYQSTFDMSNTVKFVLYRWHGEEVDFTRRGKFGVVSGSIKDKFKQYHLYIETGSREDFDKEKIAQQLDENTGMKSKVLEKTEGHQMRGFIATQLPNRGPVAKKGPQISSAGAVVEVAEEVQNSIHQVRSDDDQAKWMLAEYQGGNPKGPIVHVATGDGDIEEMKVVLKDDMPMYGLYRTTDVVDDITTVKFVFITWVGESVKPMVKAKISTHKGTAEQTFGPYHVSIYATNISDISKSIITEKVTSASGTKSNVK